MPVVVERIAECCELGEGPHWDPESQSLYYVDIFKHTIHRYKPSTKEYAKAFVGASRVSFIIPIEGAADKYLISFGRQILKVTWDGVTDKILDLQKIVEVETDEDSQGNRINDAKCDASGRLWCGTMGPEPEVLHITPEKGSLYSVSSDGTVKHHFSLVSISNGLAWNSDNTKLYYIDSPTRKIRQFDFDLANGEISNEKVIFSLEEAGIDGYPDGQTIDTDGNLWVAVFDGYRVIKINPRKYNDLLETINIPAKQVTSVAFGGENLDELYVTSASMTVDGEELTTPNDGALYKVSGLGVKGFPAVKAKFP